MKKKKTLPKPTGRRVEPTLQITLGTTMSGSVLESETSGKDLMDEELAAAKVGQPHLDGIKDQMGGQVMAGPLMSQVIEPVLAESGSNL
uniref:Uncharacterized protein n=1 Tax=Sphaerodactylus townsendi TaxID=933632 RepID=A0ACB8EZE4_9SAUR